MSFTLRVVVNPYNSSKESSEEPENHTDHRNAYLVSHGFPPITLNAAQNAGSGKRLLGVQQVVTFHIDEMKDTNNGLRLPDIQRIFLENLINTKIVKYYTVTNNVTKTIIDQAGEEF